MQQAGRSRRDPIVSRWLQIICCWLTAGAWAGPVMQVVHPGSAATNLLRNPDFEQGTDRFSYWSAAPNGYRAALGQGRNGTQAMAATSTNAQAWFGASQTLVLNRTNIAPIVVAGWSKADSVDGVADADYSIYVDLTYRDGTPLWGQTGNFATGTHDWQQRQFIIMPEKPVRSLTVYCLFRTHTGSVWFDDISVSELGAPAGSYLFQGTPVTVDPITNAPIGSPAVYATQDGLRLALTGGRVTSLSVDNREISVLAPSGFLARDVAADSDIFAFQDGACPELGLRLNATVTAAADHLAIEGTLTDTRGVDRAIMLAFALPMEPHGRTWWDDIRHPRPITDTSEFSNTSAVGCGANGRSSVYPVACVNDSQSGLALAIDMGKPAQYRLACQAGTRQFLIAFDFGLVKDTAQFPSSAPFRFVLYRYDPGWGFRAAFEKFTSIFPKHFQVRSTDQGIWIPFTDVATVQGWQDFGFRYHEGNNNVVFDDAHGILSFRYTEPMTWWMPMALDLPRTIPAALAVRDGYATGPATDLREMAEISRSAAMWDTSGQPEMLFQNQPWASGAVWSLNPNPHLPADPNAATVYWNDRVRDQLYGVGAPGRLDGEYLDSLEGYVTADLNFRRDHFAATTVPLTFEAGTARPALWKGLGVFEFTRWISDQVHQLGKLCFANGLPYRFAFLCPWLDVLGTETDWLDNGAYAPATHEQMCLWRTMAGKKPYLLLMNTDFDQFGSALVERYFQRSLFYGMYPSMFSHNAADNPYWQNPIWYNRDRLLFRRYIPLIKEVAEAGWQPVTQARCENTNIWVERFGPASDGTTYFTLFNESAKTQSGSLSVSPGALETPTNALAIEMLNGVQLPLVDDGWPVTLLPQTCAVVKIEGLPRFVQATLDPDRGLHMVVEAPLGSVQVLEASTNLSDWRTVATNTITMRPFSWSNVVAETSGCFYRLRMDWRR